MKTSNLKAALAFVALIGMSGCGTYTPNIREVWGQEGDEQRIVKAIVRRIHCEIREAVTSVIEDDIRDAQEFNQSRKLKWFETWGAQATLTLSIDEKSNLNPGVIFNTPIIGAETWFPGGSSLPASQAYTLGLGGSFATTANRIDKLNWFYTVADLRQVRPQNRSCASETPGSYLIVDSDLKLKEWLAAAVVPVQTDELVFTTDPKAKDVISHQVKFEIQTSGDITPTWRLVRVTANGGGPFFGAGRTRTQDLTITFGPTEVIAMAPGPKHKKGVAVIPVGAAQNAHLASQIGLSVANNLLSTR